MQNALPNLISYKQVFNNSSITAMVLLDTNGKMLDANVALESNFGYTPEELVGKNFSLLFIPEDRLRKLPELELAIVNMEGSKADINYLLHKNGSYIWTHGETIRISNERGEPLLLKIIYNINKEKLLEQFLVKVNQEINDKNLELERINKEQETFVYMASHDLKAPINNIESLVTILQEGLLEDCKADVRETLEMIQESITKFQNVIAELGKVGKAAAMDSINHEIYFSEVVEDVKLALREEIRNARATFSQDFYVPTITNIPARSIRSILYNLISNSVKYRSPDRRLEINISTTELEEGVLLAVSDNGLGINKKYQDKIFDVYQRAGASAEIEGTGVGLSIVERLVKGANGKIKLESVEGKGTTFKIYLNKYS